MREATVWSDYLLVVLAFLSLLLMALAAAYIAYQSWYDRWLPFKCKGVDMFLLSSLGGGLWILSVLVIDEHFEREQGSFRANCVLWSYWMNLFFGQNLWINCLAVRMMRLYRIFHRKRRPIFQNTLTGVMVLHVPTFVFVICATAFEASQFDVAEDGCRVVSDGWKMGAVALGFIPFLVFFVLGLQLKNVRSEFNEYTLLILGGAMAILMWIVVVSIVSTDRLPTAAGRFFVSLCVVIIVNFYFWSTMGMPVYKCLLKDQEYLERFEGIFRSTNPWALGARLPDLMRDDLWRERFKAYAKTKFCAETIEFWEAVHKRAQGPPGEMQSAARDIVSKFIVDDAPQQVNLPDGVMRELLESADLSSATVFDHAREEVFIYLNNGLFKEYVQEDSYRQWQKEATVLQQENELITEVLSTRGAESRSDSRRMSFDSDDESGNKRGTFRKSGSVLGRFAVRGSKRGSGIKRDSELDMADVDTSGGSGRSAGERPASAAIVVDDDHQA